MRAATGSAEAEADWRDRSAGAAAGRFNSLYGANPSYYGVSVPRDFRDFLAGRPLPALNCLDLGAGQGRYALHLARGGARVTAVDRSAVAMAQLAGVAAEERLAIVTEVADLCRCDFPVNEYDLIVGATIFDHLDSPCRHRLAEAITAALSPGGHLYCEVFTTADPGCHRQPAQPVSETSGPVRHYFAAGELPGLFPGIRVLDYREEVRQDRAHGRPHWHGLALLVGAKG